MTKQDLNPIVIEVLWTRIISAVDEAAKVIVRTSFSTLSNEANDFACVLTDENGHSLAQNTGSIPSFIGTLPATVKHFLTEVGRDQLGPDDVLITNDPWKGTGHLNDISLIRPIFLDGALVAFAATTAHMPDIGGRMRSIEPREVFEEGLHIPLMHFIRDGVTDQTLVKLLRENVRTPDETLGDVWAQVGALHLIERRVVELMQEHRLPDMRLLSKALMERSEAAMRDAIRSLPDGIYEYEMVTDGVAEPITFKVAVKVCGDSIEVDFAGTTEQQPCAINCVMAYTFAMTVYALKCALLPNIPNNEGIQRCITVHAVEGSILNPRFPSSVGSRSATGHYVPAVIFGALHRILPMRVMAASGSPLWIINLAGVRADGKTYATVLFFNGGTGGRASCDGVNCLSWPSNISATPVEVAEHNGPLLFHYKRLSEGSGGVGEFRGGLGQDIMIESMSRSDVTAVFITERTRFPAPGIGGGSPGGIGQVLLNDKVIDNRRQWTLCHGDRLQLRTPGGGGFGYATARAEALIEKDKQQGYS